MQKQLGSSLLSILTTDPIGYKVKIKKYYYFIIDLYYCYINDQLLIISSLLIEITSMWLCGIFGFSFVSDKLVIAHLSRTPRFSYFANISLA